MTPPKYPKIPDSDYSQAPDEAKYQRKLEERKAFAALLAAEIIRQQPQNHVCNLPAEWLELFKDPTAAKMIRSMAAAYADSEENRKTIRQLVLSKVVDVSITAVIAVIVLGLVAWIKQVSH